MTIERKDTGSSTTVDRIRVISVPAAQAFLSPEQYFIDRLMEIDKDTCDGVVIDLCGLTSIDSTIVAAIAEFSGTLAVLNHPVVICGILPRCAITMVEMRLSFGDVPTVGDAQQAIDLVKRKSPKTRKTRKTRHLQQVSSMR